MRIKISERSNDGMLRERKRVEPLGIEMYTRVWGWEHSSTQRMPLVLIAGLGMSSRYWTRLGRRMSRDYYILAPDMPGFGHSSRPAGVRWPGGPDVGEQAMELLAWLDARQIDRAILCGHSTGCQTVVEFAVRFPERVEKLILITPTFEAGNRSLFQYILRLGAAALFEVPSLIPLLVRDYLLAGPARVVQQVMRMMDDPIEKKLPLVEAPTLVIAGKWDTLVSQRWAEKVAELLRRGMLVVIEGAGHAVQYSAPVVTERVVRNFLAGKLDVQNPPADRKVLAPVDDPQHDPFGPIQPISPRVHGVLDYLVGVTALVLPRLMRWGHRPRNVWTAAAVVNVSNNLVTDHPMAAARKLPMVTHASVDMMSGIGLLVLSAGYLRKEKKALRWATAGLGCYQILSALLTAKPTGPARYRAVRGRRSSDSLMARQLPR